jgi:hypothetical protein
MMQELVQGLVELLVNFATSLLLPSMLVVFTLGVLFRALIYFTIQREMWFANEFQRRVEKFMNTHHDESEVSFFIAVKRMLEKTFYEAFIVRAVMKRRRPDYVMSIADRLFLIQQGAAFLVRDTLKQIKFLRKDKSQPKLLEISKSVLQNNPCFSRVFGIIPINVFNDMLNILPGLFIVGGIFGTFLGIMKALPELSGMDLEDIEGTKLVMDTFLLKISFSMSTSIIGIVLSVSMNVINTFLHPEKLFMEIVEKYENSLDVLWNRATSNEWSEDLADFDEHRDPLEALAEDSLAQELLRADKESKSKDYNEINIESYDIKNAIVDNTREPKKSPTSMKDMKSKMEQSQQQNNKRAERKQVERKTEEAMIEIKHSAQEFESSKQVDELEDNIETVSRTEEGFDEVAEVSEEEGPKEDHDNNEEKYEEDGDGDGVKKAS